MLCKFYKTVFGSGGFTRERLWFRAASGKDVVARNAVTKQSQSFEQPAGLPHFVRNDVTSENMSLLVNSISGVELSSGCQIAALANDGTVAGSGFVDTDGRCGLAVWGDDTETDMIDGLKEGEAFTLKLWDPALCAEFDLDQENILTGYTGLSGSGLVYEKDGFTVIEANAQSPIPDNYYLSQNYPNPFNSYTKLTYGLPEDGYVSIRVYDISGRLVETMIDGLQTVGHHSITWTATETSGVYIVKLRSKEFDTFRKVVLIR